MSADQDTEITLGTGKILFVFFGLVVLCAVFFGVGYNLGKSASSNPVLSANASATPSNPVGPRPSTAKPASPAADNATKPADLTFYKAVEQKDANPQLTPPAATNTPPASAANPDNGTKPPAPPDPAVVANPSPYYVQVAAVSKQEDADSLVEALKKKQYPAFALNNLSTDKLYHVQVGPYADIKDAEAIRAKLISDGYNPILKK